MAPRTAYFFPAPVGGGSDADAVCVRACVRPSVRPCVRPSAPSAPLPVRKRSHAAWRSFFSKKKRSHAAWRSKCSAPPRRPRAPVLVFPIYGASSFLSCCIFGALVLCFPMLWRRPFHFLNFWFSAWTLWCFNFQYAALPFFQFLASPWVVFWVAGSGRARSTAHG